MDIQIGDTVRFLHEVGGGKVTGFQKGNIVLVEDADGFEIPMLQKDVVVIPTAVKPSAPSTPVRPLIEEEEEEAPPTEEDLRIAELQRLYDQKAKRKQQASSEAVSLGHQANSPLRSPASPVRQATVGSRTASSTTQASAEAESTLSERVAYLERVVKRLTLRIEELEAARSLRELSSSSLTQNARISTPHAKHKKEDILEIDLHIHALLDSTAGMEPADIKAYQLKVFRETMEAHKGEKGRRIVFIHGNGDGVLRKAIVDELKAHYRTCQWQDASFQQYGFGATMVILRG